MGFCALYHQTIIFTGKMLFIRYGQHVLWSQKVCQKYSSQQSGEPNFKNFPLGDQYGSTLQDTDLANSKETQIMRKNSCKQKYLDKNLDVWFLRHGVWQTEFFVIKTPFSLLTPLITQKIKILKKWKKAWRQYHFTHVYHKWKSYMMCGSWDMEPDRKNFLSFCTILYPFT